MESLEQSSSHQQLVQKTDNINPVDNNDVSESTIISQQQQQEDVKNNLDQLNINNNIDNKIDSNHQDADNDNSSNVAAAAADQEETKANNSIRHSNNGVMDLKDLDDQQDNDEHDEFKDAVSEIQYDLEKAKKLKEEANEDFKEERYDQCIRLYDQAIQICPPEEVSDLAIFYNNKGICYTKLKNNKEAKKQFSKAIAIKSDYVKPRALRMKIYREEEEFDVALEDAKKIKELDPSYPGIHKTVMELDQLQKEKFEKMKTEVLGNLKSFGNTILGKFGMSLDNFKLNQNPDGTYNINYQNQ